jgi:FlaA1/EpsC-like NDP-sugar epimerase
LITLSGHVPDEDIQIVFTGLRPGEKLAEELLTEEEEDSRTVRQRIQVASSPPPPETLLHQLAELKTLADAGDREAIVEALQRLVPTYRPSRAEPHVAPAASVVHVRAAPREEAPGGFLEGPRLAGSPG